MAKVKQLKDKNGTTPVFPITRDSVVYNDDNEPIKEYTDKIGSGTLTTTSQTIIPAINELESEKISKGGIYTYLGGASSTDISQSGFTNVSITNISNYTLLRICASYYISGVPDYGGITLSVSSLRRFTSDGIVVARWKSDYAFTIKYVNDTTLAVNFNGTPDAHRCFGVSAIL